MFDPVQQAADAADHAGAQAARSHEGANTLNAAFQVVETFYYSKKYPGSPEQIAKAMARGRALVNQWRTHTAASNPAQASRGAVQPPHFLLVPIGKTAATNAVQMAVFDTHAEQVVGNNIYELSKVPKTNSTVKFDTYTTQYVGNGTTVQ